MDDEFDDELLGSFIVLGGCFMSSDFFGCDLTRTFRILNEFLWSWFIISSSLSEWKSSLNIPLTTASRCERLNSFRIVLWWSLMPRPVFIFPGLRFSIPFSCALRKGFTVPTKEFRRGDFCAASCRLLSSFCSDIGLM